MFFSRQKPRMIKEQIRIQRLPPKGTPREISSAGRRTSVCPFLSASLTVEAAFLVPLFLLTIFLLWNLFQVFAFQVRLQYAMDEMTAELAQRAYAMESLDNEEAEPDGALSFSGAVSKAVWKAYVKKKLIRELGEETLTAAGVQGGLSLAKSQWDLTGDIRLVVGYRLQLRGLPGVLWKLSMEQFSLRKCWTGKQAEGNGSSGSTGELVYVTAYGKVCHRDIQCYHLKVTVRQIGSAQLGSARNASGGKYYPCEHCAAASGTASIYYVTPEGDRYHVTRDCSGLKRMIRTARRENCRLPECSHCGK